MPPWDMHRFEKWRHSLMLAPDAKSVAAIMAEYVKCFVPSDLAALPASCQAILTEPGSDLQGAAVQLLQEEMRYNGPEEARALLHEAAHTFAAASIRLGQLFGRGEPTVPK